MEFNQNQFERWFKSKGQPLSLRALDHFDRVVIWIAGKSKATSEDYENYEADVRLEMELFVRVSIVYICFSESCCQS